MADAAENRVAVYIDFDNIVISRYDEVFGRGRFMADRARNAKSSRPEKIDPTSPEARATVDVGAILDYATSFGSVVISRAFADWSAPANSVYSRQLVNRAVDLTQMFPTTGSYQKNGADIRLSVDVVEDMFRLPDITHVVIVAGDSDFIPLAQSCKRLGRYVVGIGVAGASSKSLAAACNEFKFYGELPGVVPAGTPPTSVAEPEVEPVPEKKSTARRASKPQEAPEPEPVDRKLSATELLVRALRVGQATSDDEWLHSGGVKSQMMRMDPTFSEKSLGFKSFSDFVKSREAQVEVAKGAPAGRLRLRDTGSAES